MSATSTQQFFSTLPINALLRNPGDLEGELLVTLEGWRYYHGLAQKGGGSPIRRRVSPTEAQANCVVFTNDLALLLEVMLPKYNKS